MSTITEAPAEVTKASTFQELGVSDEILASVKAVGFEKPTEIQARFIPEALTGNDVLGQAKTGTGKTAAFLLPIFHRLHPRQGSPSALILAPTRELAMQIQGEIERLGHGLGFTSITIYGGAKYEPQIEALARGVDIVVGTPGRVMDHMRSGRLDFRGVKVAVLDEADRMLDLGFRKDIEFILKKCPKQRQTLLLSATLPEEILGLAKRFMIDPSEIYTATECLTVDQIEQFYLAVESKDKWPALLKVLDQERPALAIIFCQTKREAKRLAAKLKTVHINAREIHGDLVQAKREKIMTHFRKGRVQILVATDVASRGIDVDNITHIINYDIPYKKEDYVHRVGRTGRMDRGGKAITLCNKEDAGVLTDIEMLINHEIAPLNFVTLESHFWPHPPSEPLPEFASEDSLPDICEADYISADKHAKGPRGLKGGGRRAAGRVSKGRPQPSGKANRPEAVNHAEEAAPSRKKTRKQRASKAKIEIVCSECKTPSMVNFKPDPSRPVYCPTCYEKVKGAKQAAAE